MERNGKKWKGMERRGEEGKGKEGKVRERFYAIEHLEEL
jgi:hypothetical protein